MSTGKIWARPDAEKEIGQVLDAAKLGSAQRLVDVDGIFEIVFHARNGGQRLSDLLVKRGPVQD